MQTIHEQVIASLPISIAVSKDGKRFTVTYWKQRKTGLTYEQAAQEFGECVMHALACDGKLDS